MAYGDDLEICDLLCVASPLLGAREGFGNPDCVHIVVRFTVAHITFILLCCTRCGVAMVFRISRLLLG